VAIDDDFSRQSIVCAGIGALLPASGWQEVYRSN